MLFDRLILPLWIYIYVYIYISIMSAKAGREVGGGGGDARLKGSLALVQKILQLTSTHNNSLRTL